MKQIQFCTGTSVLCFPVTDYKLCHANDNALETVETCGIQSIKVIILTFMKVERLFCIHTDIILC